MMDGHAGHGHGLARGGIFVEFLDGVSRPSGRSPNAVTAPAHGHSNASATTATTSRNAARPAAPATPAQPPSESTPSNPEQPDRNYATWHWAMEGPSCSGRHGRDSVSPPGIHR